MIKINLSPLNSGPYVTYNDVVLDSDVEVLSDKRYQPIRTAVFSGNQILIDNGELNAITTDITHSALLLDIFDTKLLTLKFTKKQAFI